MRALLFTLPLAFAAAPSPSCEQAPPHCAEDDPCFDRRVHGNKVCGPDIATPTTTPPVTVVLS